MYPFHVFGAGLLAGGFFYTPHRQDFNLTVYTIYADL